MGVVSIRLPADIIAEVDRLAVEGDRPRSYICRALVEEALDRNPPAKAKKAS